VVAINVISYLKYCWNSVALMMSGHRSDPQISRNIGSGFKNIETGTEESENVTPTTSASGTPDGAQRSAGQIVVRQL